MAALPDSFRRTFEEQQALLAANEEVPSARTVVTALVLHYLRTGERLLPESYTRCSDFSFGGCRVYAGVFGAAGFAVNAY